MKQTQLMIRRVFVSKEKLKAERESRDLTQAAVAKRAGVPTSTVGRLEDGSRNNPTIDIISRIAKAIGCTVDDLLAK